ncbi:hypothetical protein [Cribrihabitans pelagius]|uniref:hypothetical protein n=1 Tax=Cribrihabitans pelagius TaxID=1765746 RepID=UPI003B5C07B4
MSEFIGFGTAPSQRTAETAGCAAAQNLIWLRETAEFAKGRFLRFGDLGAMCSTTLAGGPGLNDRSRGNAR